MTPSYRVSAATIIPLGEALTDAMTLTQIGGKDLVSKILEVARDSGLVEKSKGSYVVEDLQQLVAAASG